MMYWPRETRILHVDGRRQLHSENSARSAASPHTAPPATKFFSAPLLGFEVDEEVLELDPVLDGDEVIRVFVLDPVEEA